ncbi:hypothetical protein Hanom_Chr14g01275291 [Helianthus anomalus]
MATFQAKNADRAGVVIILQFAKVKTYGDSISVSNCYEVARLFIDEDIDDVASFKKRYCKLICFYHIPYNSCHINHS